MPVRADGQKSPVRELLASFGHLLRGPVGIGVFLVDLVQHLATIWRHSSLGF